MDTMLIGVGAAAVLLVVLIVVVRRARARQAVAVGTETRPDERAAGEKPPPAWAVVALAAYLTAEGEQRERPSAGSWRPEVNHYDPWLAGGRSLRRQVR